MATHGPVTLQVLGTGGADTAPCLLLHVPRKRGATCYLFNAPEGMQRLCGEQHVRLSGRLQRVLLTSLDSSTIGGLPGLLITLADAGHGRAVPVHGPLGTASIVRAASHFMPAHAKSELRSVHEIGGRPRAPRAPPLGAERELLPFVDDEGVRMYAILLDSDAHECEQRELAAAPATERPGAPAAADGADSIGGGSAEETGLSLAVSAPGFGAGQPDAIESRAPVHSKRRRLLPAPLDAGASGPDGGGARRGSALSYAIELPGSLGKFDAQRAAELGVMGALRGRLCKGEAVTLPCGRVVRPEDVLAPGAQPQLLLVLRTPSAAHAAALAAHAGLRRVAARAPVAVCVHICEPPVWRSAEMAALCGALAPAAHHLLLSAEPCASAHTFVAGARLQMLLHAVHPTIYPLPHAAPRPAAPPAAFGGAECAGRGCGVYAARLLARVTVCPPEKRGLDLSECARLEAWTNSAREPQALDGTHLRAALSAVPGLARAVSELPPPLRAAGAAERSAPGGGPVGLGGAAGADADFERLGSAFAHLCRVGETEAADEAAALALRAQAAAPAASAPAVRFGSNGEPAQAAPCSAPPSCALPSGEYDEPPAPLGLLRDGEIAFLGTGAAMPSKYRNVSATLLRLPAGGCLMLDCGEGTLGQLRRRYGMAGAAAVLCAVSCFWVSHAHADHHLGLPALLAERARALRARREAGAAGAAAAEPPAALVLGPRRLEPWLCACVPCLLSAADYEFAHCSAAHARLPALDAALVEADGGGPARLGITSASVVHVEHCADAWALLLTVGPPGPAQWSLGFSGDTRPCEALVHAAQRAPRLLALIHEATFEDELAAEALSRRHATVAEAICVGAAAGAYRTLLTHFSQRYPKMASASGGGEADAALRRVCFATDLMSVPLALLRWAPAVTLPAQRLLSAQGHEAE